jgi:hypothetical protein
MLQYFETLRTVFFLHCAEYICNLTYTFPEIADSVVLDTAVVFTSRFHFYSVRFYLWPGFAFSYIAFQLLV